MPGGADMVCDPKSTIGRLNIGRLYERYVKGGIIKTREIILNEMTRLGIVDVSDTTSENIKHLFLIVVNFINLIENELTVAYNKIYKDDNIEAMMDVLEEVQNNKLIIYMKVDDKKRKYQVVNSIKNSIYAPTNEPVTFKYNGKDVTTKENVMVAPMYIFLLSKIADTILSTSSSKINHFGIPIVTSKFDKERLPHTNSPVRFLGETDFRIISGMTHPEFTAELRDRNSSVEMHSLVYDSILKAKDPAKIDSCIDRRKHKYGTDRGLEILNSLWNTAGMGLKYVNDKKRMTTPISEDEVVKVEYNDVIDIADSEIED